MPTRKQLHKIWESEFEFGIRGTEYIGTSYKPQEQPIQKQIMKTLKKVPVEPVYLEFLPELSEMEEGKIYISREYKVSKHKCLCGCGELVVLPFSSPDDWKFTEDKGKITFTPSVGNYQFACKSHYIITNGIANFV